MWVFHEGEGGGGGSGIFGEIRGNYPKSPPLPAPGNLGDLSGTGNRGSLLHLWLASFSRDFSSKTRDLDHEIYFLRSQKYLDLLSFATTVLLNDVVSQATDTFSTFLVLDYFK